MQLLQDEGLELPLVAASPQRGWEAQVPLPCRHAFLKLTVVRSSSVSPSKSAVGERAACKGFTGAALFLLGLRAVGRITSLTLRLHLILPLHWR